MLNTTGINDKVSVSDILLELSEDIQDRTRKKKKYCQKEVKMLENSWRH